MKIAKVDYVSIPSQDAERAREFYRDVLDTCVCHMAFFHDPDGNDLMLHRRYAPYE